MMGTSPNTSNLMSYDPDGVLDRHGRLGPAAVLGALDGKVAHLATHDPWVCSQPAVRHQLVEDLRRGVAEPGGKVVDGSPDASARGAHRACEAQPVRIDLPFLGGSAHEGADRVVHAEHAPGLLVHAVCGL